MYKSLRHTPFYLFLFLCLLFTSCEKEDELTPEEQRSADASFNNSLTPGVGNVFYEEKLVPNTASQLVFKLAYHQDTLAAYGKINGSGQLEYLHTTVLAKKGGDELLVTETFPETYTSRMYSIINGEKSNIVVEIKHYSQTKYYISILDLDWGTGNKKVLKGTYIKDGVKTADYSGLRLAEAAGLASDHAWNCDQPQPSDDLDQTVDNHLDYFACGGLAWDTHPTLDVVKETITSSIEAVKSSGKYADKLSELAFLENSHEKLSGLYAAIKGKVKGYRFERTLMAGLLKLLEEKINKLKESQYDILLVPFEAGTDTEYDEVTDNEVKVTFTVTDAKTKLPFKEEPVLIDMAFIIPGTDTALKMETKASSTVNGLVTFKFDPTSVPGYEKYSSLEARWGFTSDDWQKTQSRSVSLRFINPKVVLKSGAPLPSPVNYVNEQSHAFRLVNEDGRAIAVDYSKLSIKNVTNSSVGYTLLKGTNDFSLKLYTDQSTTQSTSLDIYYGARKVQTISAAVNLLDECDQGYITAPIITGVQLTCGSSNIVSILVSFKANGSGVLVGSGSGWCEPESTCYPVRLYFFAPGSTDWEIAYNGYSASLVSGNINEGVIQISISKSCESGKTARETLEHWYRDFKWEVELMNKCNQRSARVAI